MLDMAWTRRYTPRMTVPVYRVYDFTNYSTLRQWPFLLMRVAVTWGAVASAASALTVRLAVQ